jgi:Putative Ig domain
MMQIRLTNNVLAYLLVSLGAISGTGCREDQATTSAAPPPPGATNTPPVITGSPPTKTKAGTTYRFQPTAKDPDGNALSFEIRNRPSWGNFSSIDGSLTGTPTKSQIGTYKNIVITVSDGAAATDLPAFSISVDGDGNIAPTIDGKPVVTVKTGGAYIFTPAASDANGDALTFSVQNKPSWASFNSSSGQLSGTPGGAAVGTFANIVISVSDGKATTSLPSFSIVVTQPGSATGSAALSWTPPTENTDGSAITNLAGYRIYYGTDSNSLSQSVKIDTAGVASYVVTDLSPATWFFAVRAFNSANVESAASNVASKTIM